MNDFNRKNKIIGFKPNTTRKQALEVDFSRPLGKWHSSGNCQKSNQRKLKLTIRTNQKKTMHHALWQKLFSLSLKPKEPTSGNRFGVTPLPWWGLFSWNWNPIQLFIGNFRKKMKQVKLLFSENVLPYLLKTAKDLFTHSRDKHNFNGTNKNTSNVKGKHSLL